VPAAAACRGSVRGTRGSLPPGRLGGRPHTVISNRGANAEPERIRTMTATVNNGP